MLILLETNQRDKENRKSYRFEDPSFIIRCHRLSELKNAFDRMEKALAKGFYLAGFLSYEAGYAFEDIFHNRKTYDFPLLCFGAYTSPLDPLSIPLRGEESEGLTDVSLNISGQDYLKSIKRIKHHLTAGDTYQVNYTFKQKFNYYGKPFSLYQELIKRQATSYSAFIETDDFSILSLSPELFFRKNKDKIKVKPMKGTIPPGKGNPARLRSDSKNLSENIMIVDLLRNDLGRIAQAGTVKPGKIFEVEKYETLYQMTSTVEAKIPKDIELYELFRNLYPSGSVTGAPKIRTMQIIQELEKEERKIYTGSIGFITPGKDMVFNVAIRTLLLDADKGEMGIGSGIVYDSDPAKEFDECLLKANFLFGGIGLHLSENNYKISRQYV